MRQALHWAGLLHGEVQECFESYDERQPVTEFYDAMVSGAGGLARSTETSGWMTRRSS